jgi:tetratricopeptide (TPR) repeat protein
MSAGAISEAINAFQAALEINPTYSRARSKLAVCLFEEGHKQQALEQLVGPDCSDKGTFELHYKTALLYCDKLKFASSLLNLDHLMETNFACTDSAVNISIVLQNLGLLDRATAMWDNLCDTAHEAKNTYYRF